MHLNFLDLYLDLSLSKSTVTSEPENYFLRIFMQPYKSGVRCNQVTQPRRNALGIIGTYHAGYTFQVPCSGSKTTLFQFHLKNYSSM